MQKKRVAGSSCALHNLDTEVNMSQQTYVANLKKHMQRRAQLLAALDKAIAEVGPEKVAMAFVEKEKTSA